MNCNTCCGCFPPITTYNPSAADNFPTILQQVEYLKALLKKYPSQQWFITQEKVTEETVKLDSTKISLRGRAIAEGDFILGNAAGGTTLMFQYTGATVEVTYYVVEFVGVYSNQNEAQEALQRANGANELAGQALSLAQANEQDITSAEARITSLEAEASIEVTITPANATNGILTEEQYNTLITNDNCYIKLNEVIYTLSKNSATGVLIYSSKYLSDTKKVRTITVTKATKAWVMTEVDIGGGGGSSTQHLATIAIKREDEYTPLMYFRVLVSTYKSGRLTFDELDNFYNRTSLGWSSLNGALNSGKAFNIGQFYHSSANLLLLVNNGSDILIGESGFGYASNIYAEWSEE